jgi:hypothetical protein
MAALGTDRRPRDVVLMTWLDLIGIIVVCTIVFMLVSLCERDRH